MQVEWTLHIGKIVATEDGGVTDLVYAEAGKISGGAVFEC